MVIVIKFGGSLLTNAKDYLLAAKRIIKLREEGDVIVIVSAMKGVTSRLVELMSSDNPRSKLMEIFSEHIEVLRTITKPSQSSLNVMKKLMERSFRFLERSDINKDIVKDEIVSLGERLSTILLREALRKEGVKAIALHGGEAGILTNENYGNARPLFDECLRTIYLTISPIIKEGIVPVIAGFIGITKSGRTTTLGRGGSDLTASLVASAIEAKEVLLFTNVPGIMTCDPLLLKNAKVLPKVSLNEVNVMAKLRVKKFHPLTFYPILHYQRFNMRIFIGRPEGVGTHIVKDKVPPPIKVVSELGNKNIVVIGHGAEIVEKLIERIHPSDEIKLTKFENYVVLSPASFLNRSKLLNLIHSAILRMLKNEVMS